MKILVLIIMLIALAFLFVVVISKKGNKKDKKPADKKYVDILKSIYISERDIAPNSGMHFTEESMNSAAKDFKIFIDFAATLGEDNERK